jgi:hypothetical protein
MPISARRNFGKGAVFVVEAHGQVLFMPGAPVYGWAARFANATKRGVEAEAPVNKRPRWAHYGKPLKESITSTTPRYRRTAGGARVYAAVGSTAPYAVYVDQGTGVYGGGGPYLAKILPPTAWGAPNLYEASWVPPGSDHPVRPVMIKGQPGQHFFQKGLERGFEAMRMRSYQVPGDPKISAAMDDFPSDLRALASTELSKAAFLPQLQEWRAWRDEAWKAHRDLSGTLGPGNFVGKSQAIRGKLAEQRRLLRKEDSRRANAERQRRWRERHKLERSQKINVRRQDGQAFLAVMRKKYGTVNADTLTYRNGAWYVTVEYYVVHNGRRILESREVHAKAKT